MGPSVWAPPVPLPQPPVLAPQALGWGVQDKLEVYGETRLPDRGVSRLGALLRPCGLGKGREAQGRPGRGVERRGLQQATAAVSGTGWEPLLPTLRPGSPEPWGSRGAFQAREPTLVAQSRASIPGPCQAPVPVPGVRAPARGMCRGAGRVLQSWEGLGK